MMLVNSNLYKVALFSDSRHVIYKILNGYITGSIKCHRLYDKVVTLLSRHYEFYHILRENNVIADELENVGDSLPQGHLQLNGVNSPPIPFHYNYHKRTIYHCIIGSFNIIKVTMQGVYLWAPVMNYGTSGPFTMAMTKKQRAFNKNPAHIWLAPSPLMQSPCVLPPS